MPLVSIESAMDHLRADPDDIVGVTRKLEAAETIAANYMGRSIYADELTRANDQVNAVILLNAMETDPTDDETTAGGRILAAERARATQQGAARILRGVVIDPAIEAAILLILGTLYEHREDIIAGVSVTQLPIAAEHRLQPYRILGV